MMGVVMIMLLLLSKDRLLVPKGSVMVVVAAVITHLQVLISVADSFHFDTAQDPDPFHGKTDPNPT